MKTVVFLVFMAMLFYAIYRGRDVRLSVWLLGTNASLEVTDRHTRTDESGGEDHDDRRITTTVCASRVMSSPSARAARPGDNQASPGLRQDVCSGASGVRSAPGVR